MSKYDRNAQSWVNNPYTRKQKAIRFCKRHWQVTALFTVCVVIISAPTLWI